VKESLRMRVARAEDYDRITAVVDDRWGRSVSASLPRPFLDHFWSTSRVVDDERGLAAFLIAFVSPSQPLVAYVHFVRVRPDHRRGGLARRLYDDFARQAQARGARNCARSPRPTTSARSASTRPRLQRERAGSRLNGPGRSMVTFRRHLSPANAAGQL
jgi:GNAT superfamily N-acetyltransferase